MERTISFMNGEGSIGHNTRAFIASNVDADRTKDNIILANEDIKMVYHKLFDEALAKYNAKQKRKDRQIKNYYDKIARSKQEKLFYEVIVQIGNRDDTDTGSYQAYIASKVLEEYVESFIKNNPQLYVFGAYIHMDEETPHVHIDFVPWSTDNQRGLETKNSLKGALASRGFKSEGKGNTEWQQWCEVEKEDIANIMKNYNIEWKKLDTHNQHLSVLDYKKQERQKEIKFLEQKREVAEEELDKTQIQNEKLQLENIVLKLRNEEYEDEHEEIQRNVDNKKIELLALEDDIEKNQQILDIGRMELERVRSELNEFQRLKKELQYETDGDYYLKEQVIELRFQNQELREENLRLSKMLEKTYEFMKQFIIGGINMLERFREWIGEKVRDGRGR